MAQPPDMYTHLFKFKVNGAFIEGEAEFNSDDKASFKMTKWSEPIPLDSIGQFEELMELIKKIYKSHALKNDPTDPLTEISVTRK